MDINFLDYRQELQRIAIQKLIVKAIAIIFLTSFAILSYWGYQQIKIKFSEIELEKLETRVKSLSTAAAEVQGMKLNIKQADLAKVLKKLPALRNPTVNELSQTGWVAVDTVIEEHVAREIIPSLKAAGAEGIIEYPLNKVVY